jgi:hypothetical protein
MGCCTAVQTFPSGTRGGGNYVAFAKLHGLWLVTFNDGTRERGPPSARTSGAAACAPGFYPTASIRAGPRWGVRYLKPCNDDECPPVCASARAGRQHGWLAGLVACSRPGSKLERKSGPLILLVGARFSKLKRLS